MTRIQMRGVNLYVWENDRARARACDMPAYHPDKASLLDSRGYILAQDLLQCRTVLTRLCDDLYHLKLTPTQLCCQSPLYTPFSSKIMCNHVGEYLAKDPSSQKTHTQLVRKSDNHDRHKYMEGESANQQSIFSPQCHYIINNSVETDKWKNDFICDFQFERLQAFQSAILTENHASVGSDRVSVQNCCFP